VPISISKICIVNIVQAAARSLTEAESSRPLVFMAFEKNNTQKTRRDVFESAAPQREAAQQE